MSDYKCMITSCKIKKDDEFMVSCWLCEKYCHIKCAPDLTARDTDTLRKSGVHWCCLSCRNISVRFYKFYKNVHLDIAAIGDDLSSLVERFSKVKNSVAEYSELDTVSSVRVIPSPKRKRPALNPRTTRSSPDEMDVGSPFIVNEAMGSAPPVSIESSQVPGVLANGRDSIPGDVQVDLIPSDGVLVKPAPPVPMNLSFAEVVAAESDVVTSPMSGTKPRDLIVIPPKKTIFVSRFAPDTTVDEIKHYVLSRIGKECPIDPYRMKGSYSDSFSSFRIVVPDELFTTIVDRKFWPPGSFVKEFVYRESSRRRGNVRLPSRVDSASKN